MSRTDTNASRAAEYYDADDTAAFYRLCWGGSDITAWLAIAVVSRDIMIVMAFMVSWVMAQPMAVKLLFLSKVNTALQIVLAALVLGGLALGVDVGRLDGILAILIVLLTIISAGLYLARWLKHMTH